jgi:2,3-bisphosphoglycerate-dependent phosphoglycerate mutase
MQFLVVRHCKAEGQEPEAMLTEAGRAQAEALSVFINKYYTVGRVWCSPYRRAVETARPLGAERIVVDDRLKERSFSGSLDDLEASFTDVDLRLPSDGDCGQAAQCGWQVRQPQWAQSM